MRRAIALLAMLMSALWAAPALAAPSPKPDLAAWVGQNTDLAASQVAIAGPDNVYSLEPLGPQLPTGEVLALVRTEAVSEAWGEAHRFESWDAHLLFDCQGGRVRVLRSASYAERDRGGFAKVDERGDAWFTPQAKTPAATLLSAACDSTFSWPLRGASAAPSSSAPVQAAAAGMSSQIVAVSAPQEPVHIERAAVARLADALEPAVMAAPAGPISTPAKPRREVAASPDMAQFTATATAKLADRRLQGDDTFAAPARREPSPVSSLVAASRTCRRLAGLGGGWIVRRLEVALRREHAPSHTEPGLIRQAQAY